MNLQPLQQGDVLIIPVNSIPKNCENLNRSPKGFILAQGEATGHAHVIEQEIEFYRDDKGQLFFRTENEVIVKHDEHEAITVPPGIYRIDTVQEYDHFAEEAREVRD